ncbi:flagellar biosynthesis protein FlhF [Bacillus massiliglaciei]|uniref:flagellar biosynthesis protein FlhF n=1 Tax=Bacillus massiliglaciei TaxID=1816693 RepID=UPI000AF4B41A|nr:flagellar biosynthesis protein FlhF [Bacillus massiliglaciei]
MKVKKFSAPSMTEAMKQIRSELGNDAVILNSKPVYTGGFLGMFKKRTIEVIAAIDPEVSPVQQAVKQKTKKAPSDLPLPLKSEESSHINIRPVHEERVNLEQELTELKGMLKTLQDPNMHYFPGPLKIAYTFLQEQELDVSIRTEIMEKLLSYWHSASISEEKVWETVNTELKNILQAKVPAVEGFQKKFINIVGPTGVGKTTTIAKVAAEKMLTDKKKVAFITTDTYRIAAIDQLKTYAKILNVPLEVAYNLEDFKRASEKFSHYDYIFIDTAGRNFRNEQYVKDLSEIIDITEEMETFLVLSLTSKQKDMEDIYRQFSSIPIQQFIFTKADETSTFGSMINMMSKYQTGAAYITNGQNVPDDIEEATDTVLINTVMGAVNNGPG